MTASDPRIAQYLDGHALTDRVVHVVPLTGDASDRRYYRVLLRERPSVVLAVHQDPIDFEAMPFVLVSRLFTKMGLPVPALLHHSDALGIIGQEDLGDVTLQAHVGAAAPEEHAALYRQAVAFIARLQERGEALRSDAYPPYGIAFDVDKLTWELEFFVKHYLVAYRGAPLSDTTRDALRAEWAAMVSELAAEPRVLCHRDFHSRNLMLHAGSLHLIDFQDARMGPDTYDLVSLLRDSYVDVAPSSVDDLIADFLTRTRGSQVSPAERAEFRRRFDLMALQRNLKVLGTFGYQATSRNNTVYIQYIPRTVNYVKSNLAKYPRFERLRKLVGGWL